MKNRNHHRNRNPNRKWNHTLHGPSTSLGLLRLSANFDHKKLDVYLKAIPFVAWAGELREAIPKHLAVHGQLDRAATSIPLNIAEGNGKYTAADRCRFFDIARGSALECSACLDMLVAKKRLEEADSGKLILGAIVSMLVELIRSNLTISCPRRCRSVPCKKNRRG